MPSIEKVSAAVGAKAAAINEKPAPKDANPRAPKGGAVSGKEKKPRTSASSHPPYFEMIKEAIMALKERAGSSPYAIAKFMEEKHAGLLPPNYKKILAVQLKKSVEKEKLVKVKASFKLSDAAKKDAAATKKAEAKKKPAQEEEKKASEPPAIADAASTNVKKKTTASGAAVAKKAAPAKPKRPNSNSIWYNKKSTV